MTGVPAKPAGIGVRQVDRVVRRLARVKLPADLNGDWSLKTGLVLGAGWRDSLEAGMDKAGFFSHGCPPGTGEIANVKITKRPAMRNGGLVVKYLQINHFNFGGRRGAQFARALCRFFSYIRIAVLEIIGFSESQKRKIDSGGARHTVSRLCTKGGIW